MDYRYPSSSSSALNSYSSARKRSTHLPRASDRLVDPSAPYQIQPAASPREEACASPCPCQQSRPSSSSAPTWEENKEAFWASLSRRNTGASARSGKWDEGEAVGGDPYGIEKEPTRLPTPDYLRDEATIPSRSPPPNYESQRRTRSTRTYPRVDDTKRNPSRMPEKHPVSDDYAPHLPPDIKYKLTSKWPAARLIPPSPPTTISWRWFVPSRRHRRAQQNVEAEPWNISKWCLLFSSLSVFAYGMVGLFCFLATCFDSWTHADVLRYTDPDILALLALSSAILLLSSVVGFCGTLLHSRPLLALYALFLWPAFVSLLTIGYVAYKRAAFALDRKLNLAWSEWYTPLARLVIQESLACCGYHSPLHEAAPSASCFARTRLPGCKGPLLRFERRALGAAWAAAFALVPLHVVNIAVALLCANHVDGAFGGKIMPRRYWLTADDLRRAGVDDLAPYDDLAVPELTKFKVGGAAREDREERLPLLG